MECVEKSTGAWKYFHKLMIGEGERLFGNKWKRLKNSGSLEKISEANGQGKGTIIWCLSI